MFLKTTAVRCNRLLGRTVGPCTRTMASIGDAYIPTTAHKGTLFAYYSYKNTIDMTLRILTYFLTFSLRLQVPLKANSRLIQHPSPSPDVMKK